MSNPLLLHIEALIFAAEQSLTAKEIKECLEEAFESKISIGEVNESLKVLMDKYTGEDHAFELREIDAGYRFMTKPAHHRALSVLLKQRTRKRLSQAALETLAIIAYKQPVSKNDVEKIRGVNSDYSVQKLLEKELIAISGRSEQAGRPLLYSTGEKFMDYLGLKSIADLPKLKDFALPASEIGEPTPIEEDVIPSGDSVD